LSSLTCPPSLSQSIDPYQGYCLWDGHKDTTNYGTYSFMQAMRKELPEGCTKLSSSFPDGSTYYVDMKPQQGGDMTLGVYKDSGCKEESKYDYEDYQGTSYASGSLTASASNGAFDAWNSGMDAYKVCQPCRAYNREVTEDEGRRRNRRKGRRLGEENDGQGDEEQHGYNCYDDAGYQNVNQCYKFETHSDMEEASAFDLSTASSQGTILRIKYNSAWYGYGLVGDVTQGNEGASSSSSNNGNQSNSNRRKSSYSSGKYGQYQRYGTSYSFVGGAAAILALGGAASRIRRRRAQGSGTLDDGVEEDQDESYVELSEPREREER